MDRRNFFRKAFNDSGKAVVKHVAKKARHSASRWIRPPFASDELTFLLACTRCDACIEACDYDVIFKLSPRLGAKVAGTPALDLLHKGCHLCIDWPCVNACEPDALRLPDAETVTAPKLAAARIDTAACLPYSGPECGACAGSCPIPDALLWNMQRPEIDDATCVGCGLCREACIHDPSAIVIESLFKSTTDETTSPQKVAS